MVIVDTSVWVDHLCTDDEGLRLLLLDGMVSVHPYVVGEIACGHITNRAAVLQLLRALPQADVVSDVEYFHFIEKNKLWGAGLGFVDIHILASASLSHSHIFTRDKALHLASQKMKLSY
jgi:predicted nucleic acid-binding protein